MTIPTDRTFIKNIRLSVASLGTRDKFDFWRGKIIYHRPVSANKFIKTCSTPCKVGEKARTFIFWEYYEKRKAARTTLKWLIFGVRFRRVLPFDLHLLFKQYGNPLILWMIYAHNFINFSYKEKLCVAELYLSPVLINRFSDLSTADAMSRNKRRYSHRIHFHALKLIHVSSWCNVLWV